MCDLDYLILANLADSISGQTNLFMEKYLYFGKKSILGKIYFGEKIYFWQNSISGKSVAVLYFRHNRLFKLAAF